MIGWRLFAHTVQITGVYRYKIIRSADPVGVKIKPQTGIIDLFRISAISLTRQRQRLRSPASEKTLF